MITNKEIEKILEKYEESYAPWEMDEMDCPQFLKENLIEFGRKMYELGKKDEQKEKPKEDGTTIQESKEG